MSAQCPFTWTNFLSAHWALRYLILYLSVPPPADSNFVYHTHLDGHHFSKTTFCSLNFVNKDITWTYLLFHPPLTVLIIWLIHSLSPHWRRVPKRSFPTKTLYLYLSILILQRFVVQWSYQILLNQHLVSCMYAPIYIYTAVNLPLHNNVYRRTNWTRSFIIIYLVPIAYNYFSNGAYPVGPFSLLSLPIIRITYSFLIS